MFTTRPDRDRSLLPLATRFMHESEESTGLVYSAKPRLKVYATVAEFRNSTGEPGWVAASTKGKTIQMQPPDVLRDAGTLDSTIHHELLHMLIDSYTRAGNAAVVSRRVGAVSDFTERGDATKSRVRAMSPRWRDRCALRRAKKSCATLTLRRERASPNWRSNTAKTLCCSGCRTACRQKQQVRSSAPERISSDCLLWQAAEKIYSLLLFG